MDNQTPISKMIEAKKTQVLYLHRLEFFNILINDNKISCLCFFFLLHHLLHHLPTKLHHFMIIYDNLDVLCKCL